MIDLKDKKTLVSGGTGFFGRHVCKTLKDRGANVIEVGGSLGYDLRKYEDSVVPLFNSYRPEYVISLAANTGGIVYNKKYPADLFYDNIQILTNTLKACAEFGVEKVVNVTTSCSYPDGLEILKETDYWNGLPNPSVEFFGIAKRASESYGRALYKQYGLNVVTACVTNLYGPGDRFDENGKVVSNLIKKFWKAKQENIESVTCFGIGLPKREFLYVTDAAELLVRVLERYDDTSLLINIGRGTDITIKELAEAISYVIGYHGQIIFDPSYGDGQMKKLLDITRMKALLEYEPQINLLEGLQNTIDWYKENIK